MGVAVVGGLKPAPTGVLGRAEAFGFGRRSVGAAFRPPAGVVAFRPAVLGEREGLPFGWGRGAVARYPFRWGKSRL